MSASPSVHQALSRDFERDRLPLAFLAALLIASCLALGLVRLARPPEIAPSPPPVRLALVQLPTPPSPPPPVAAAPEPLPSQPDGTLTAPPPQPVHNRNVHPRAPPRRRMPAVARRQVMPAPTSPTQPDAQPSHSVRPLAPRPPAGDPAARDSLIGRIKRAIQSAFRYPEAARDMGAHGTVLIGFVYRDRLISNVRVLRSSASPILDRAAVEIVRSADPPPPGNLAGRTLSLETPIVFDIVTDDD